MGLMEKIEDIRRKPEHIRKRYVWFFVGISMMFIVMIWFFSFDSRIAKPTGSVDPYEGLGDIADQFDAQKDSMRTTIDSVKDVIGQEAINKMQDGSVEKAGGSGN